MRRPQDPESSDEPAAAWSSAAQRCHTAYVGLGANLGDRLATLRRARLALAALGSVTAVSPIYETAPVGFADQPPFLNAALRLATALAPEELLAGLLRIEHELGRARTFANAPRTIDLDLLFYDEAVVEKSHLVVPHPHLHERAFVLVPLNDIAPDLVHPQLKRSVSDLLRLLGTISGVERTAMSLDDLMDGP